MSLRNVDYTDRELLHVIADVRKTGDHAATSEEIASALGITSNGKSKASPAMQITARLSWMARYGFLFRVPNEAQPHLVRWAVTPIGEQLMHGRLSATIEKTLDRMDPGSHVLTMRHLTQRAYVQARPEVAIAVRREYLHQIAKRR